MASNNASTSPRCPRSTLLGIKGQAYDDEETPPRFLVSPSPCHPLSLSRAKFRNSRNARSGSSLRWLSTTWPSLPSWKCRGKVATDCQRLCGALSWRYIRNDIGKLQLGDLTQPLDVYQTHDRASRSFRRRSRLYSRWSRRWRSRQVSASSRVPSR